MHRRSFLGLLGSAAALPAAQRPNVLLIMADDFGFECLSGNGSTSYKTPNLDKLAADGMIFVGPDKPNFYFTNNTAHGNGADAKASGWYAEGGWYIPNTKFELDARFDTYTSLEDRVNQFRFDKWTLGVQYHFNPKTRITLNYEIRDFECDSGKAPCTAPEPNTPNYNLKGVGNKVGLQLTAIF